jgi:uncharacterized protein (DUF885 family)
MFNRRHFLLGSVALAGCASTPAPPASPDPAADTELRAMAERLAQRSRASRLFMLQRFDASRLTADGRVLYRSLIPGAEADAALSRYDFGDGVNPYTITHRAGAYRRVAELRDGDTPRRSANALDRETGRFQADAARGVAPPDFALAATIRAVEQARARVAASNDSAQQRVIDALTRQIEAMQGIAANASNEPGLWRLPDGEAYYAQVLKLAYGAAIDSREAHAMALDRCRTLQAEADALLRAEGLTQGDVGARLRALAADPRYLTGTTDAGKAVAVATMNEDVTRIRALMPQAFSNAEALQAEVRRVSNAREANGAAGGRSGTTYAVDLGRPRPVWTLPSVVNHELIPGHILQASYERAAAAPALQGRYAAAYSEGWATYAEMLADELGGFAGNPRARIGYLQWMLFRVGRIVIDTGIHAMRWNRERAIAEMIALQGESIAFVTIEEDVSRFTVQPGQYAAQGLSALHIHALRERTRREARGRFTLARFHDAMLRHGPLSPPGLDEAARAEFALG